MTIGKLSRRTGVGIETIRYYEREGLMEKPARRPGSNYRDYGEEAMHRLLFIRRSKDLGFTLAEIRDLLSLAAPGPQRCDAVRQKAEEKILDVEKKIGDLKRIRASLEELVEDCRERGADSDCLALFRLPGSAPENNGAVI